MHYKRKGNESVEDAIERQENVRFNAAMNSMAYFESLTWLSVRAIWLNENQKSIDVKEVMNLGRWVKDVKN